MRELQFFDPKQEVAVVSKSLPHWAQAGTITFITWRMADSLPAVGLKKFTAERDQLLRTFQLNPRDDWKAQLDALPAADRRRIQQALFQVWDDRLDAGHGDCQLSQPEFSQIVLNSLLHFDGDRYFLTDAVVMPNHVHLLAAFRDEDSLLQQCSSWKRYTARQINAQLGARGEFWQVEQFDHLVRSAEHFDHYRHYIAENPRRARLAPGTYRHFTKSL
jgi:putative transposase